MSSQDRSLDSQGDRQQVFPTRTLLYQGVVIAALLFAYLASPTPAQEQPRIIHLPVTVGTEGQAIALEAKLEGVAAQVDYFRIYYRRKGAASYRYVEMTESFGTFSGEIPKSDVVAPGLEYFLTVLLTDQNVLTYPEFNPYNAPVEVSIQPAAKEEKPLETEEPMPVREEEAELKRAAPFSVLVLSPEADEPVDAQEVVIAISLLSDSAAVDPSALRLFVDGEDVTAKAEISPQLVSYAPSSLQSGLHGVKLDLRKPSGKAVTLAKWSFRVAGAPMGQAKPLKLSGRAFADSKQEHISGNRLNTTTGGTTFKGKYSSLHFGGNVFLTSLEKSDRQPRNRFTFNVGTSWLDLTFGDTYPRFNELILFGKRVRGFEGEVKLGFLNVDLVTGETVRAIDWRLVPVVNPATGLPFQTVRGQDSLRVDHYGTFRQRLLGIRPSFGSGRHFQFGLNLIKVKDDVSSIQDTVSAPKDNLVFGPDLVIAFDNHRAELRAAAVVSLISENIRGGPLTKAKIDSVFDTDIPFDPADFEKYFVINASTTPIDPSKLSSLAYQVSLKLNYWNNLFRVTYKSIGPEYNSLGTTFLRKDLRGIALSDRIRLLKNLLYLTLGYENYRDNFSGDDNNPPTTLRTLSWAVSVFPGQNLPKVNFNFRDYNRDNGIGQVDIVQQPFGADTLDRREDNTTRDVTVQVQYDVNLLRLDHSVTLSLTSSDRTDRFGGSRSLSAIPTDLSTDVRMITLKTKYEIPLTTSISYASTDNKGSRGANQFKFSLLDLQGEYLFFSGRLRTYAGVKNIAASGSMLGGGVIDYTKRSVNFGGRFQIDRTTVAMADFDFIRFNDHGFDANKRPNPSFNDRVIRVRLEKNFAF